MFRFLLRVMFMDRSVSCFGFRLMFGLSGSSVGSVLGCGLVPGFSLQSRVILEAV